MKKISLPISNTVSLTVDLKEAFAEKKEGQTFIPLGTIDVAAQQHGLEQARTNGGRVIWATTTIEHSLENLITDYLFGYLCEGPNMKRQFFTDKILSRGFFSYAAKKELVLQLVSEHELLKGKDKSELQKLLKKVMDYRNAFAHGKLSNDNMKGCVLEYDMGGRRTYCLSDKFWTDLENEYANTNKLLKKVASNLCTWMLKRPGVAL